MKCRFVFLILFAALMVVVAPPARAFTESGGSAYANSDGTSKFSDPDEKLDETSGGNSAVNILKFGDGGAMRLGLQNGTGQYDNTDPRSALSH